MGRDGQNWISHELRISAWALLVLFGPLLHVFKVFHNVKNKNIYV